MGSVLMEEINSLSGIEALGQVGENRESTANGASFSSSTLVSFDRLGYFVMAYLYYIYKNFTLVNVVVFVIMAISMYKILKSTIRKTREKIQKKQMELEDIKLQVHIVNSKLSLRDAEFAERSEQLQRETDRLRILRARIRYIVSTDEELSRVLQCGHIVCAPISNEKLPTFASKEENDFMVAVLKEIDDGQKRPESEEYKEGGDVGVVDEHLENGSVYSSVETEQNQDCQVKIVKVTNVYKMACLKHNVKQRRLRRANPNFHIEKKIENIQRMLENWHQKLNVVLYNKITMDRVPVDLTSQEAMGDYSKHHLRECSDSDSELKTFDDNCYDDWSQNNYNLSEPEEAGDSRQKSSYNTREYSDRSSVLSSGRDVSDEENYKRLWEGSGSLSGDTEPECHQRACDNDCTSMAVANVNVLFVLPEETSSQIAIAEKDTERERDVTVAQ